MRLLFAYTKFLNQDGTERFHRGFSHLSLNFSTDKHFSYHDGILSFTTLKCPIPTDFFGDRIYNITTIVGDNGAGKTTILHYLINLLQQLYEGQYHGNDCGFLVVEDRKNTYVLEYYGKRPLGLNVIPNGFAWIHLHEQCKLLSATKLIYLANTLTHSDFSLVRHRPVKADDNNVNVSHFRYEFLYNCSTASLMIENCQNDSGKPTDSATECLNCFFFYEQYKQVKYVFDKRQFDILEELRGKGYPVPVPKKLYIELQSADYHAGINNSFECGTICIKTQEDQYDWLVYELCFSCVEGFLKTELLHTNRSYSDMAFVHYTLKWNLFFDIGKDRRKRMFLETLERVYEFYQGCFGHKKNELFIQRIYKHCTDFLEFVIDEKEHLQQYFELDPIRGEIRGKEKQTITFSIKTTGEAATWFITFLQKYRYTCEPYYYLQFHWGLSSGEQNLLRLFSSLYYIFNADYNNPERGDYKINTINQDGKNHCDSVMLWLDEADLTYHPEWQRRFLSILTAFLPKIYPNTCCRDIQIFLTTHSPLMLGDSPAQSVIYLSKNDKGHVIIDDSGSRQTFGENLYMLLQRSFRVKNSAIGELVRIKIQDILDVLKEIDDELLTWSKGEDVSLERVRYLQTQLQNYKEGTVAFLADGIIKAKLETEIIRRLQQLNKYAPTFRNNVENDFSQLSDELLERQWKAITEERERRKEEF